MPFRQITETTRIEKGPPMVETVATAELLSNEVTATHYQEGRLDAVGTTIELDKPIKYLDWLHPENWVWYVYKLDETGRYIKVGTFDDEIDAALYAKEVAE
jgi:hypothetical protein